MAKPAVYFILRRQVMTLQRVYESPLLISGESFAYYVLDSLVGNNVLILAALWVEWWPPRFVYYCTVHGAATEQAALHGVENLLVGYVAAYQDFLSP
jgi:hypothetical protein